MATTLKGVGLSLHTPISPFDLDFIISSGTKTKGPQLLDATRWIDLTAFPPTVTSLIQEKKKKKPKDEGEEEGEGGEEEEEESEKFERLYQLGDKSWVGIVAKQLNIEFYSFASLPPKLQDGVLISKIPPEVNNFIGVIAGRIFVTGDTTGYIQISGNPDSEWIETKELPLSEPGPVQSFVFHLPPLYPRSQPPSPSNAIPLSGLWWGNSVYLFNLQTNKFQKLSVVDGDAYDEKTKTYSDFKFLEVYGDDSLTISQTLTTVKGRSFFIMSGCLYEARWEADSPPPYDLYGDSSAALSTSTKRDKGAPKVVKKKGKKGKEDLKEGAAEAEAVQARLVVSRHLPWMDSIIGVADCDPLGLFLMSVLETEDMSRVLHVYRPAAPKESRDKGTLALFPADTVPKERDVEIITYSEPANMICLFLTPTLEGEDGDEEIPRGDIVGLPTRLVSTLKFQPVAELYDAKALAVDNGYKIHVPKNMDAFAAEPLQMDVAESYPRMPSLARPTRIKEMWRPKLPSDDYHVTVHWKCPAEFLSSGAKELEDLSSLSDYLGAPLWYQTEDDATHRVIHFANLLDFAKGRRSSKRIELLTLREQLSIALSSIQWVGIIEKRTADDRKQAKSSPKKPAQADEKKEENKYQAICKEWGYAQEPNTFLVPSGELIIVDPRPGDRDSLENHSSCIPNAATGKWFFKFKPATTAPSSSSLLSTSLSQMLLYHHSVAPHATFNDDWAIPKLLTEEEEEQKEEAEPAAQGKKRKNPPQGSAVSAKKTKKEDSKSVQVSLPSTALRHVIMQAHKVLLDFKFLPDTAITILEYLYPEIAPPVDFVGNNVDTHQASSVDHEWKVCAKQPAMDTGRVGIFDYSHYYDASIAPNPYRGQKGRGKFAFEMDSKVVSDSLWEEMVGAISMEDEEGASAVRFGALGFNKLPAVCMIKALKTPVDTQPGKVAGGHAVHQVETVVAIKFLFTDALDGADEMEDEEGFEVGEEGGEGEEGEGGEGEGGEGEGGEGEGGEGEGLEGEGGEGEGEGGE